MNIAEFIQVLPKAELHLHLEGAAPWAMVRARSDDTLPDAPIWWDDDFKFDDFLQFTEAIALCYRHILTSSKAYQQVARAVFQRLAAQNVRYVEISFAIGWAVIQDICVNDVAAAIKRAAPSGLTVCVIGGISRERPDWLTDDLKEAVLSAPDLDGIDLHGDETLGGPAPFVDIFARARQAGLLTKAHAGELAGPQSIKDTLELLGVNRIEHGTTAMEDEALLARLAAEGATLDMCPWSNVKLRVVDNIGSHPIRRFLQQGIRVTANTDDPTVFGYSLSEELLSLVKHLHFTPAELAQLQINAFRVAKMSNTKRDKILSETDALLVGKKPTFQEVNLMTTIAIQAEEPLVTALETIAKRRQITIEDVTKEALWQYLKEKMLASKPYSFAGIGHSGKKNLSTQVEDILTQNANRREGWSLNE